VDEARTALQNFPLIFPQVSPARVTYHTPSLHFLQNEGHLGAIFKMAVALSKENADFSIKPEAITPSIPTSEWPLLLKNYDKRETPTILAN
jgi:hypothetical protein